MQTLRQFNLLRFKTSLKLPILLAAKLSVLKDTNPSRPTPMVSILLEAKFKCSNLSKLFKPIMVSI